VDDRAQGAVAQPFHEGRVDPGELGRRRVEEGDAEDRGVLVMASRGLISTVPRLPMTAMRPRMARAPKSFWRFTFASISRMTSTP